MNIINYQVPVLLGGKKACYESILPVNQSCLFRPDITEMVNMNQPCLFRPDITEMVNWA